MTKFKDKVSRLIVEPKISGFSPQYLQRVWTILIGCGGVTKTNHNYYSSTIDLDYQATRQAYADIVANGIDWAKCTDPEIHIQSRFNGTFNSEDFIITYLEGDLFLTDGTLYRWGSMLSKEYDRYGDEYERKDEVFGLLVRTILHLDVTLEEALEELEERLNGKGAESFFDFSSMFPLMW